MRNGNKSRVVSENSSLYVVFKGNFLTITKKDGKLTPEEISKVLSDEKLILGEDPKPVSHMRSYSSITFRLN